MTAEELRTQLKKAFDDAEAYKNELNQKLSDYDLQEQDLLHYLENKTCDAVDLVKIATKLKSIRQQRRKCKVEQDKVMSAMSDFNNVKIHWNRDLSKFDEKTYTNRTNVIDSMVLSHKADKTK